MNQETVKYALTLLWKGMLSVFVTVILLMIMIYILTKFTKKQE